MRHVPVAEFKDRLSEFVVAAEAGERFVITRHGREVARLVPVDDDVFERRRQSLEGLARMREEMRARGVPPTTQEEIRAWVNEGRR
jgi:prevent-host-death family protein